MTLSSQHRYTNRGQVRSGKQLQACVFVDLENSCEVFWFLSYSDIECSFVAVVRLHTIQINKTSWAINFVCDMYFDRLEM